MILLVTSSAKAPECARAIENVTGESTRIAASLRDASNQLREAQYELVVIEQGLAEADSEEADALLQHLDVAMPLYVNFAISGIDRVVREVRAALHRHKREVLAARRSARENLRNELKGTVTALLLSCEMALQVNGLPQAAELKLHTVDELAREMKQKLEG